MGNCNCKSKPKIVSNVVRAMNCQKCNDVCTNPICGEPKILSMMTPVIYDEIGINLCATFTFTSDVATTYPTATNACVRAINLTYADGVEGVSVTKISQRPNCWTVTLSNITVTFAVDLYDSSCRLLATLYEDVLYLPPEAGATYDSDTNPSSVDLEIFAPYGISYVAPVAPATAPTATVNPITFYTTSNFLKQGINLYARAKLLDLNIVSNTATVGVTFIVQSLYFAGYRVESAGKTDIPKGSIISPENSDCMRFVAGELLDLAIKPLDLSCPANEQCLKNDCNDSVTRCGCDCDCKSQYKKECKCDNGLSKETECLGK